MSFRRTRRKALAATLLLAPFGGGAVWACGPYFPFQLFDQRAGTLLASPEGSFYQAEEALVPVPDVHLKAVASTPDDAPATIGEPSDQPPRVTYFDATQDVEQGMLPEDQATLVASMRAQGAGDVAYKVGAGLPEAIRSYVAGAVAFQANDSDLARTNFARAVALTKDPQAGRLPYAAWSAYMLGRVLSASDPVAARQAFEDVRQRIDAGASDPLGVGVASYGEEARSFLQDSGLLTGGLPEPAQAAMLAQAVALYARQARYEDGTATESLQTIADALLADDGQSAAWMRAMVADPLTRRLMMAYVSASSSDDTGTTLPDGATADRTQDVPHRLFAIIPDLPADEADAGAVLAYQVGDYRAAGRLAARAPGVQGAWVTAKIAVRRGDFAAARIAYAMALARLKADKGDLSNDSRDRINDELAVLAMGDGDFGQALRILYPTIAYPDDTDGYWGDIAYLAERLIPTNDLIAFVHADAAHASLPLTRPGSDVTNQIAWTAQHLRALLARRLMREGRSAEAMAFFVQADDRAHAQAYATARDRARHAFWRGDRAKAAWEAALLAREHGLEILATEIGPDYAVTDGQFDSGYGPDAAPKGPFTTDLERARYAQNAPDPNQRFHYRFVAARLAEEAASNVPQRSQAYAAMLCQAAIWMRQSGDGKAEAALWARYVAHGAVVPFAHSFGSACPKPDFAAASRMRLSAVAPRLTGFVRRHSALVGAVGALGLVGVVGIAVFRRRR